MATNTITRLVCSKCNHLTGFGRRYPTAMVQMTQLRRYSSSYNFLNIKADAGDKGIAILEMNRKPINSISLEFAQDFCQSLEQLENDKNCRAIILASACPSVFSAGLDIKEMYQPESRDRLTTFMKTFQEIGLRLYTSNMVTIAAINGSCPGAGSALALCCDYRIMAQGKHTIGVAASLLGICPPYWIRRLAAEVAGSRKADIMLQLGTQSRPDQALAAGIVDKVLPLDELQDAAQNQAEKWLKIPDAGRILTKQQQRQDFKDKVRAQSNEDLEFFVNLVLKPETQDGIGRYLDNVRKRTGVN